MTVKKINLSPDQLAIVDRYCRNDLRELKKICLPLISMKGVADMEIDDLLSDAMKVLLCLLYTSCVECRKENSIMNDTPVYEWEDAINFIAERCNIDKDTIETVLTLEEDYMKSIGIIMEEQSNFEIDGQQREQSK